MPAREEIINDILAKKELQGIERSFADGILEKELRKNPRLAKQLPTLSTRSEAYKDLVKAVRAVLRRNVGLFEGDPRHQEALLAELRQTSTLSKYQETVMHLLSTHASTRERLPFYNQVYEKIFSITGRPSSVLDFGCGLNPISFPLRDATYFGVDIDGKLCSFVEQFFSIVGIEGECRAMDVRDIAQIKKLPKSDIAFVFKLLDLIEQKGHALSEQFLKAVPAKWIIVSFPTEKISGKPMRVPRRAWLEQLIKRLGYESTTFAIPNEIFYVIQK